MASSSTRPVRAIVGPLLIPGTRVAAPAAATLPQMSRAAAAAGGRGGRVQGGGAGSSLRVYRRRLSPPPTTTTTTKTQRRGQLPLLVSATAASSSSSPTLPLARRNYHSAALRPVDIAFGLRRGLGMTATMSTTMAPVVQTVVGTRAFSQAAGSESKIWNFEEIQNLVKTPKANIVLVDVREPSELEETGRIPGSVNVPIRTAPDSFHVADEEFEDRHGFARPAKDAELVIYCRSGVRARAAAGLAREAGWKAVGEYPGSWLDWFGKGGEVQR